MKPSKIIISSVLISALVCFIIVKCFTPSDRSSSSRESAYNHVVTSGTLRCGYATWPPFLTKDPNNGEMSGILVDIINEIGKTLNLKIDWTYETGFGNYVEDLNSGRFDVMCATLWADYARIKNSLLIDPFLYSGVYLIVRKNDARFDKNFNVLDNEAMTMTGVDGDITATLADRLFPKAKKMNLPNTASAMELAENVKTKKADAMFADLGFFKEYDAANPGQLKILLHNPAWVFGERMAVKNGEHELKYMLDTAITELVNSGKIAEIMKKYPGTSSYPPTKNY